MSLMSFLLDPTPANHSKSPTNGPFGIMSGPRFESISTQKEETLYATVDPQLFIGSCPSVKSLSPNFSSGPSPPEPTPTLLSPEMTLGHPLNLQTSTTTTISSSHHHHHVPSCGASKQNLAPIHVRARVRRLEFQDNLNLGPPKKSPQNLNFYSFLFPEQVVRTCWLGILLLQHTFIHSGLFSTYK